MPGFASMMPRPSAFMIATAISSGLKIPAIEIDPRFNFVRGAFLFASDIDKMGLSFKSWKEPLLKARDEVIIPSIKQNFQSQGRPAWKPLAKSTIYNRLMLGFPRGPILQRTGRLKRAATQKNIWEVTQVLDRSGGADMLLLRTEYLDQLVPYARFHQLGARLPQTRTIGFLAGRVGTPGFGSRERTELFPTSGGKLPARPYIQITIQEEIEIYNIFAAHLARKVAEFWGPETRGL